VSRRSFLQTIGLSAAGAAVQAQLAERSAQGAATARGPEVLGPGETTITLSVNGEARSITCDPSTTLLDALRREADLTGTKEICDRGACGGCSVLIDGKLQVSCMMLAIEAVGAKITTIEGLVRDGKLDPVQQAFIQHDALQCGYCTPGLVMASRALLNSNPKPSVEDIKRGLSGNVCRCGTYTNIINAVLTASGQPALRDTDGKGGDA